MKMRKMLVVAAISLIAWSANAMSFSQEVAPSQAAVVEMYTSNCAKKPKVITKGDRVIIIYDNGKVVVVDGDGTVVVVP